MEETRRARKKRQTRELLVRTAFRLFKEQGYEQTTIAQISAEADIATKTFFNYFSGKEDVVFTDAERYYELTLSVIEGRHSVNAWATCCCGPASCPCRPDTWPRAHGGRP